MLRVGDFILANAHTGASIESGIFIVKENNGTVVDVSNIFSLGLADTD
jgi:hypothetical protein